MEYTYRTDLFSEEKTFLLTDESFCVRSSNQNIDWPYHQIKEIRLKFKPSRMKRENYECCLTNKNGEEIRFSNYYFEGVANFKNKKEEYLEFLGHLHQQLVEKGKNIVFKGGSEKKAYITKVIFYALLFLFLLMVMVFLISVNLGLGILKLVMLLLLAPTVLKDIKSSKPVIYDGKNIPSLLIPH